MHDSHNGQTPATLQHPLPCASRLFFPPKKEPNESMPGIMPVEKSNFLQSIEIFSIFEPRSG